MTRRRSDDGLRAVIRERLPGVHWTSIENGLTDPGIPDLEGHVPGKLLRGILERGAEGKLLRDILPVIPRSKIRSGVQIWIECKATIDGRKPNFETAQPGWLDRRARCGGVVWVACRRQTRAGGDDLLLWPGGVVIALIEGGTKKVPPTASWSGGPGRWDWDEVVLVLCCLQDRAQ